jgi:hypothetical protein
MLMKNCGFRSVRAPLQEFQPVDGQPGVLQTDRHGVRLLNNGHDYDLIGLTHEEATVHQVHRETPVASSPGLCPPQLWFEGTNEQRTIPNSRCTVMLTAAGLKSF